MNNVFGVSNPFAKNALVLVICGALYSSNFGTIPTATPVPSAKVLPPSRERYTTIFKADDLKSSDGTLHLTSVELINVAGTY